MKRAHKIALFGFVILAGLIALGGGIHHQKFTRFVPTSPSKGNPDSEFSPSIFPAFSKLSRPHMETILPGLLYFQSEADHDPHVFLSIRRGGQSGFEAGDFVTIDRLSVIDDTGKVRKLIDASAPKVFRLESPLIYRNEDLGAFDAISVRLEAQGYVTKKSGVKTEFAYSRRWRGVESRRTGLGLVLGE